ncbi:MAG TPA: hypothetical protein VK806_06610, partial [Bacteroidia bacterium]|nr:hypothetical protein [Bacteroidia bacterium]
MTTQTKPEKEQKHMSLYEAVLARFNTAAKLYNLPEDIIATLIVPQKQTKVSLPVMMDSGKV